MLLALMVAVGRLVAPVIVLLLLLDGVVEGSREGKSSKKIFAESCSLQQGCVTEGT